MKKIILIVVTLILLGLGVYAYDREKREKIPLDQVINSAPSGGYVSYKSAEYGPEFTHPRSWGMVEIKEGADTCPEEDTYRTADTLNVYNREYRFQEIKLPGSESFLRTGIRVRIIDPKRLDNCGDEFLWKIANKEIDPRVISSVMLNPIISKRGLNGIYNPDASRLNTESRRQYTYFIPSINGFYVIQTYMSFVPRSNSPELKELEGDFNGNMRTYLQKGKTAILVNEYFAEFEKMSESVSFISENK